MVTSVCITLIRLEQFNNDDDDDVNNINKCEDNVQRAVTV